jgi:hypothetical protein
MMNLRSRKAAAMVVVVDFLLAVLLMQQAILSLTTINKSAKPPRVETLGVYAVVVTWPDGNRDDVDLYVEDPAGNLAYFSNTQAGDMHLERDDLGDRNDPNSKRNQERVILRAVQPGEYVVNVHMYSKREPGTTRVKVELWRLRGSDESLLARTVTLGDQGQEETAFRFTMDGAQRVTGTNELKKTFVDNYSGPGFGWGP